MNNAIPTLSDILAGRGTRAVAAGKVRFYNLTVRGVRTALRDIENDTGRRPHACFARQWQADALLADVGEERRLIVEPGPAETTTPEEAALGLRFALDIVGLRVLVPDEEALRQTRAAVASHFVPYGAAVVDIGAATMTAPGHVSVPVTFAASIDKIAITIGFNDSPKPEKT